VVTGCKKCEGALTVTERHHSMGGRFVCWAGRSGLRRAQFWELANKGAATACITKVFSTRSHTVLRRRRICGQSAILGSGFLAVAHVSTRSRGQTGFGEFMNFHRDYDVREVNKAFMSGGTFRGVPFSSGHMNRR